jgi:hypothetical protein
MSDGIRPTTCTSTVTAAPGPVTAGAARARARAVLSGRQWHCGAVAACVAVPGPGAARAWPSGTSASPPAGGLRVAESESESVGLPVVPGLPASHRPAMGAPLRPDSESPSVSRRHSPRLDGRCDSHSGSPPVRGSGWTTAGSLAGRPSPDIKLERDLAAAARSSRIGLSDPSLTWTRSSTASESAVPGMSLPLGSESPSPGPIHAATRVSCWQPAAAAAFRVRGYYPGAVKGLGSPPASGASRWRPAAPNRAKWRALHVQTPAQCWAGLIPAPASSRPCAGSAVEGTRCRGGPRSIATSSRVLQECHAGCLRSGLDFPWEQGVRAEPREMD